MSVLLGRGVFGEIGEVGFGVGTDGRPHLCGRCARNRFNLGQCVHHGDGDAVAAEIGDVSGGRGDVVAVGVFGEGLVGAIENLPTLCPQSRGRAAPLRRLSTQFGRPHHLNVDKADDKSHHHNGDNE